MKLCNKEKIPLQFNRWHLQIRNPPPDEGFKVDDASNIKRSQKNPLILLGWKIKSERIWNVSNDLLLHKKTVASLVGQICTKKSVCELSWMFTTDIFGNFLVIIYHFNFSSKYVWITWISCRIWLIFSNVATFSNSFVEVFFFFVMTNIIKSLTYENRVQVLINQNDPLNWYFLDPHWKILFFLNLRRKVRARSKASRGFSVLMLANTRT